MPWFKVDDALATHDKVLAAGNAAMGLWVRAGSWCAQHLTDGRVPHHAVKLLGNSGQAKALVRAGLWIEDAGGYRFHEWTDYQPTREHVERVREERRKAGKRGGEASGAARSKAEATCLDGASTLSNTRPVPSRPLSVVTTSSQSSSAIDENGLTRIRGEIGKGCTKAHARKTADFILAKSPSDVHSPVNYVLKAIRDEPELYAFKRGEPTKDACCTEPGHQGEWADACRACALDRKLGSA